MRRLLRENWFMILVVAAMAGAYAFLRTPGDDLASTAGLVNKHPPAPAAPYRAPSRTSGPSQWAPLTSAPLPRPGTSRSIVLLNAAASPVVVNRCRPGRSPLPARTRPV